MSGIPILFIDLMVSVPRKVAMLAISLSSEEASRNRGPPTHRLTPVYPWHVSQNVLSISLIS